MEKLKACPFCGSANVAISPYDGAKTVVCMNCLCQSASYRGENAKAKATAAWNRRAAQENKPLTLEELRQMDGAPVWIDDWYQDFHGWELSADAADYLDGRDLTQYGGQWLAYARRPEDA